MEMNYLEIFGTFIGIIYRGKEKSPHYTYPVEMLSATIPCVYRVFRRHRPDTYRIHRQ